jgi:hypothetical protein
MTDGPIFKKYNRRIVDRLSYVSLYVWATVVTCLITVVSVVTLAIVRPESGSTISTIVGITVPVMMALLAAGVRDVHRGIDGRVSQLVLTTSENAERMARVEMLRDMHAKLRELEPGSPEHQILLDQIAEEAGKPFKFYERRVSGGP